MHQGWDVRRSQRLTCVEELLLTARIEGGSTAALAPRVFTGGLGRASPATSLGHASDAVPSAVETVTLEFARDVRRCKSCVASPSGSQDTVK